MSVYDVIVVGAGLGGLSSAAILAKHGKKVLLLERHNRAGGFATSFKRGKYEFEVSLHLLDKPGRGSLRKRIFDELNLYENLTFVEPQNFLTLHSKDFGSFTIDSTWKKFQEDLILKFPEEKKSIVEYVELMDSLYSEGEQLYKNAEDLSPLNPMYKFQFPCIEKYKATFLDRYLEKQFKNHFLRQILASNVSFFGSSPKKMSLNHYGFVTSCYLKNGGLYIKGSSQNLSNFLLSEFEKNGGTFLKRHQVDQAFLNDDATQTIEGRVLPYKEERFKFEGREIIWNCSPLLLNSFYEKSPFHDPKQLTNDELGPSSTLIHFGFKKPLQDLGHHEYMSVYTEGEGLDILGDHHIHKDGKGSFFFNDYGNIDSGNPLTATISLIDHIQNWQFENKKEYKKKKDELVEFYSNYLEDQIPGFRENIDFVDVSTPQTIKRFTHNTDGCIYGFEKNPESISIARLGQTTKFKNTFLSSGWNYPGAGYCSVMLSGWKVAQIILNQKDI